MTQVSDRASAVAASTTRRPDVVRRPPRLLVLLAGAVLVVGVVMTLVGGWRTGVSWDETYHVLRMRNYLDSGWYLLDGDLDAGRPGAWEQQRYVYGPVTMVLLHAWSMLWGVDGAGQVSGSGEAFAVRHLGVTLISLVGVAAAATLARLLLRSWGWGLVAAAALVALPTWTGHAMFNVKDVPVATGYTLTTLGVAVLAMRHPSRGWHLWAGAATLVAGIVLAVGTRPGIWPGLALAVGAALVTRDRTRVLALLAAVAVAAGVLLLAYPEAFGSPVTAALDSVLESSRYGGKQGNWWYLPLFLLIELPTIQLLLGAAGVVWCLRRLRTRERTDRTVLLMVLVLLQALALPALAVARESNLYNGLRQLLFAAPALAVLVTCAIALLLQRWSRIPAVAVVGLALLAPLAVQLQLFPYNYAYSSALANTFGPVAAERNPELEIQTDYWRTSVRELVNAVPSGGFVTCSPLLDEDRFLRRSHESSDDCAIDVVGPLAPYDDQRGSAPVTSPTSFLAIETGSDFVGSNCTRIAEVTRRLWWRTVTMSTVSRCDLLLEPYPPEGLAFAGDGSDGSVLLGGWDVHRSRPGVGIEGEVAELGFVLPDAGRGGDLTLTGSALGRDDLGVAVNDVTLPLRPLAADAFEVAVPAEVAESFGDGRLVVRLTGAGVRLLDLRFVEDAS
ncbi:MAG: hypothetical protein WKF79_03215 [Nocardioides sp.]